MSRPARTANLGDDVAPDSSANTSCGDHVRITTLPDADTLLQVFARIGSLPDRHT